MKISIPKETQEKEKRVALSPDVVKSLSKAGFECLVETGAGLGSNFSDDLYTNVGAQIISDKNKIYTEADAVLKVNAPLPTEVEQMHEGAVLISFMYAYTNEPLVKACLKKNISSFAMDAVPRISRAQKMDALSSQSNWQGIKLSF